MSETKGKQLSPMETFQERLKASLRDDIARMLPDEAVAEMIKRVVEEEFFTKKRIKDPAYGNSYNAPLIDQPSQFQAMVIAAVKPIMERHAAMMIAKHEAEIVASIEGIIRDGLLKSALMTLDQIISNAIMSNNFNVSENVKNALRAKGISI